MHVFSGLNANHARGYKKLADRPDRISRVAAVRREYIYAESAHSTAKDQSPVCRSIAEESGVSATSSLRSTRSITKKNPVNQPKGSCPEASTR
jgi:hypothetical protein